MRIPSAHVCVCKALGRFLAGIAVAVVAFAWLNHVIPPFLLTDDGIRDQLLTRDCTDLGRCHPIGAPTSLPGFHQGAAWIDLLVAVRLLGGDTDTQRHGVLALLAVGAATLFMVVWRWLRDAIAVPAVVLFVAALGFDNHPSLLINPSVSGFPDVLTAAGLLCYGLSGRLRFLVATAFALGVAINVHVGSLALAPSLFALAALASPRPWRHVSAASAVLLASCALTSPAALRANVLGMAEHGRLLPALAGALAVVFLAARFGARFRALAWSARAWVIGGIVVLPFALASLWLVFWQQHHFAIGYLHPIVGPVAVLVAALVCLPFEIRGRWHGTLRWVPTVAAVAVAAVVAWNLDGRAALATPSAASPWTLAEAALVADHAAQRGWSFEDLVARVQGGACRELLAAMAVVGPPPGPNPRRDHRQLQVVKVPRGVLPMSADAEDRVLLGADIDAVVREIDSWLRPESVRACRAPTGRRGPTVCADAIHRGPAEAAGRFLFITRSYPQTHTLEVPPPYRATYEIPLAPGAGEIRDVLLAEHAAGPHGWHVTRVEGLEVEGTLPATRVRLRSRTGNPGRLVIERQYDASPSSEGLDPRYLPCLFEAVPGDPLLGVLESG